MSIFLDFVTIFRNYNKKLENDILQNQNNIAGILDDKKDEIFKNEDLSSGDKDSQILDN